MVWINASDVCRMLWSCCDWWSRCYCRLCSGRGWCLRASICSRMDPVWDDLFPANLLDAYLVSQRPAGMCVRVITAYAYTTVCQLCLRPAVAACACSLCVRLADSVPYLRLLSSSVARSISDSFMSISMDMRIVPNQLGFTCGAQS